MPELLWAQGGLCWNYCGLRGGMPELLGDHGGGVCRNFCGLRRCYAGNFVDSGGGGVC